MVPFAGWEMPVRYASIIEEYESVRKHSGIFDVSHMGELAVRGPGAKKFLDGLTCNRVSDLENGQIHYNAVLNQAGGLVDDITIYKISDDDYFVVSNASNYEKVYEYFIRLTPGDSEIVNESDLWNQIALQGPLAEKIFSEYTGIDFSDLNYYRFQDYEFLNEKIRVSRTGYTGEDGFEIYSSPGAGLKIWDGLLSAGKSSGILPCGLASRDILRLESMYALYGHELNEERTPVESGIGWIVKEKEIPYPQYEKIIEQKKKGPDYKVCPFILKENGIPRENYDIYSENGDPIGKVLSGAHSPTLKKGIGTAYLPSDYFRAGTTVFIEIRNKKISAEVTKGAFVKGTAGKKTK